jgi:hypothetical protein
MVWGDRPGYVVFGIVLGGFALSSFGGCSSGESKGRPRCESGQTRVCVQRGVSEECSCESAGSAGTGPALDGGGGQSGALGSGGAGGAAGTAAAGGSGGIRPIIDGALGSGGALGIGGALGSGAVDGAVGSGGGPPGSGRLGAACGSNVDCGAGLTCLLATSTALGGEGPAHGLCTTSCAGDAASCSRFGNDAVCLDFGTETSPAPYCVQGCTFGPLGATLNPNKCHGRTEIACGPLFGATGAACTADANCAAGQLCGNGQCFAVIPACLPQCNADSDCGTGRYCNPQTGLCRATPQPGLPLGDECTQPPAGGIDSCRGDCTGIVTSAGSTATVYTCTESCTIGALPNCNWAGPASNTPAPGLCLFSSTILSQHGGPGSGDLGSCAQLCNCNADCQHASFVCVSLDDAALSTATRRRGFCTLPEGGPGIPNCTP